MNGVFNSPSLLLLLLFKLLSDEFISFFCCCNTACLNVSSNGFAIIMVVMIAVDVIGCSVDDVVETIVAELETGTEVVVVTPGVPFNDDITMMFCRSWNKPMSSQCLMKVLGVGGNCC